MSKIQRVSDVPTPVTQSYLPEIEVKPLPSGFKPYPSPIKVSYKPYTFGEVKKMSQDDISLVKRYEYVMSGIAVDGMDKMELTLGDVLYLSMLRKLSIPGIDSVSITKRCQHCGEIMTNLRLELATVEFDELKYDLPLSTVVAGKKYSFSPLTVGALIQMSKEHDDPSDEEMLARTCIDPGYEEALAMLTILNNERSYVDEDLKAVNKIDEMMYHGIQPVSLKCPACGGINKVALDEEEKGVLVLPFRQDSVPVETRISVGQ